MRMRWTSSRSARSPSRTASWSSWRPGTERTSSARSRRRSERPDFQAMIDACIAAGVRLMIHENWRFRPWYRGPACRDRRRADRPADPAADRASRHAGPASRRPRAAAVPGDDAAADPDGHGLSPGGYGALPDRRDPDGVGDRSGRFGRSDGRRGRGDALGLLRRRRAGLARPELVHAARGCPARMGPEPDRGRGDRRAPSGS